MNQRIHTTDANGRRVRGVRSSSGRYKMLTGRDVEILKLLSQLPYLNSDWIWALLPPEVRGKSKPRFRDALTNLFHETNTQDRGAYLNWPEQQRRNHLFRATPSYYTLSDAGRRALVRMGFPTQSDLVVSKSLGPFSHGVMICEALSSIRLGLQRHPNLDFVSMVEVLNRAQSEEPKLSVDVCWQFSKGGQVHRYSVELEPDFLFGIEHLVDGKKTYRFYAVECEHTNTIRAKTLSRHSYFRKVLAYATAESTKAYRKQWGIPNLSVLTLSPYPERIAQMISVVQDVTAQTGSLFAAFKEMPVFGERLANVGPNSACVDEAWVSAQGQKHFLCHL